MNSFDDWLYRSVIVPLLNAQGKTALIDAIDADLLVENWSLSAGHRGGRKYIVKCRFEDHSYLHRIIMERIIHRSLRAGEFVSFVNGNQLDCRRHNLKLCTRGTSKYKGVRLEKRTGKYIAGIFRDGRMRHIGTFDTEEEAHRAFVREAQKIGRDIGVPIKLPKQPETPEQYALRMKIRASIKPFPK